MKREYTDLLGMLKDQIERILAAYDSSWDWSVAGSTELQNQKPLPDRKLLAAAPLHTNQCMEICVCVEGHSYIQLSDRLVVLEPGQFFVVSPGVMHGECVPEDEEFTNLWLNMRQDQRIRAVVAGRDTEGEFGIVYCRAVLVDPLVKSMLMETLDRELEDHRFGASMLVKNRMIEAMISMIRQLELEDQGQAVRHWQESVVSEVMDYLHHHSMERVELQDIAEHISISVKHLNRIFKIVTGTTVINYFNEKRLGQAKYYLTTTDLKVKDIAEQLGYYDQYHFGRVFKKATGLSPSQYRKAKREE